MPATPSQMAQSEPDLYAVLGVAKSASASEIKVSYRRLALLHHPDKNNNSPEATQQFQQVALAFKVLSDPKARKYYDKTGTTEGIDVSPEDFLADFYAIMQEMMGDFSVKVSSRACAACCSKTCRIELHSCCGSCNHIHTPACLVAARLCITYHQLRCTTLQSMATC